MIERADGGDEAAAAALEIFCYRIRKYIGAYAVTLGRLDGLVFTGGIGENSARIRAQVCAGLGLLGLRLDPELNTRRSSAVRVVSAADSAVPVLVVATNEELEIARQSLALIRA